MEDLAEAVLVEQSRGARHVRSEKRESQTEWTSVVYHGTETKPCGWSRLSLAEGVRGEIGEGMRVSSGRASLAMTRSVECNRKSLEAR